MTPAPPGKPVLLSLQPEDPDYPTLAQLTAAEARAVLGKDVDLDPDSVDRSGHWAFVRGRLRDRGAGTLSLQGTPFEEAAAEGAVSNEAAVLFRRDGEKEGGAGGWAVVDRAILPTDVAWLDWPSRHGAPSQLLGLS